MELAWTEVFIIDPETYILIPLDCIISKAIIHDTFDDYCYIVAVPVEKLPRVRGAFAKRGLIKE